MEIKIINMDEIQKHPVHSMAPGDYIMGDEPIKRILKDRKAGDKKVLQWALKQKYTTKRNILRVGHEVIEERMRPVLELQDDILTFVKSL
jgi:hypothetical protein